jgi:hypothetical protein
MACCRGAKAFPRYCGKVSGFRKSLVMMTSFAAARMWGYQRQHARVLRLRLAMEVMVVNLLHHLGDLNERDCKEIVDGKFGPPKYRTSPLSYYATAIDLAFLSREETIAALHKAHEVYGTAAALATARKLEKLPAASSEIAWLKRTPGEDDD